MAEINIGGLKMTIGVDSSQLKKGEEESVKSLKNIADSSKTTVQELANVSSAVNASGAQFGSFSAQLTNTTEAGRTLNEVFMRPLKNTVLDSAIAWGLWKVGISQTIPEVARFQGTLLSNNIQMERLGLAGGQISGILKKMGDDFVQIQPPMKNGIAITGQFAITTGLLANQFGAMAPQVQQAAQSLQLLTMGGVVGAVVVAMTAAFTAAKKYSEGLILIGQSASYAEMNLEEYQKTQKALEISGGLSAEKFASGTEAIAKNLFEAVRESNALDKLLKANNVEFEKGGEVTLKTNEAIKVMADLIKNATSGAQQLRIVQAFGVDREWIAAVEKGGAAIQELIDKGPKFSDMVDEAMIDKAKEFSVTWRTGLADIITYLKSFASDAIDSLKQLNDESGFLNRLGQEWKAIKDSAKTYMDYINDPNMTKAGHEARIQQLRDEYEQMRKNIEQQAEFAKMNEYVGAPVGAAYSLLKPRGDKSTADAPVEDKDSEGLKRRLAQLRQQVATEDQVLVEQRERFLAELDRFNEKKLLKEGEYWTLKRQILDKEAKKEDELFFQRFEQDTNTELENLERANQKKMALLQTFEDNNSALVERAEAARKRIVQKYELDKIQITANSADKLASIVDTSMSQITSIIGDQSQKGFTIFKAIAIATALVHGFTAAVAAYRAGIEFGATIGNPAVGQAMGITFAGIAAAGSAAMIAKIAGVNPGSGSGSESVSAIGAGGGGDAGASSAVAAAPTQSQSLIVRGLDRNALFSGDAVRDIAQRLVDFQKDGGKVVFEG